MSTAILKTEVQARIDALTYPVDATVLLQSAVDTVGLDLDLTNITSVLNSSTAAIDTNTPNDDVTALNAASIALGVTSKGGNNGSYSAGDIIETIRTTTEDGRPLIPMDLQAYTPFDSTENPELSEVAYAYTDMGGNPGKVISSPTVVPSNSLYVSRDDALNDTAVIALGSGSPKTWYWGVGNNTGINTLADSATSSVIKVCMSPNGQHTFMSYRSTNTLVATTQTSNYHANVVDRNAAECNTIQETAVSDTGRAIILGRDSTDSFYYPFYFDLGNNVSAPKGTGVLSDDLNSNNVKLEPLSGSPDTFILWGDENIYRTDDAGATWNVVGSNPTGVSLSTDWKGISKTGVMYALNTDKMVAISLDFGATWKYTTIARTTSEFTYHTRPSVIRSSISPDGSNIAIVHHSTSLDRYYISMLHLDGDNVRLGQYGVSLTNGVSASDFYKTPGVFVGSSYFFLRAGAAADLAIVVGVSGNLDALEQDLYCVPPYNLGDAADNIFTGIVGGLFKVVGG